MDEKLASTADRLNACLDTWRSWGAAISAKPVVVAELSGLSNESFLVANDDIKLVVRLNSTDADFGVERTLESYILGELEEAPFAPRLVHHDDEIDFFVTEYIKGSHINVEKVTQQPGEIGELFGHIHLYDIDVDIFLDPMEQVKQYYNRLTHQPIDPTLSWCYEVLTSRTVDPANEHCLCHNDLLLENIIKSETGLVAVDWEYASLGDPAFDLAVFIESYQLEQQAQRRLLDAYHGPASAELIDIYRPIYRLIEILWWMGKQPEHPSIPAKLGYLEQQLKRQ